MLEYHTSVEVFNAAGAAAYPSLPAPQRDRTDPVCTGNLYVRSRALQRLQYDLPLELRGVTLTTIRHDVMLLWGKLHTLMPILRSGSNFGAQRVIHMILTESLSEKGHGAVDD